MAKVTSERYGITIVPEEMPKSSDLKKPKNLKRSDDVEVLRYDLLGGPTVFHGQVLVFKKDNDQTITFGEVIKGPMGGDFKGAYHLTKAHPNWYAYSTHANQRRVLHVRLVLNQDHGLVEYRFGRKRLLGTGWIWYAWEQPLAAW